MKEELLKWIRCPRCKRKLSLKIKQVEKNEIKKGNLLCDCGRTFPITDFSPRFVKSEKYTESFGFEWNIHCTTQLDTEKSRESEETFLQKTGFSLKDLEGKLVLDVGCGAGRYSDVVQRAGGIVVGLDLSRAVDAAFENLGSKENTHLIQADIFEPPFAEETFDYIFSIGVLHHTLDCKRAFQMLPSLLKRKGEIAIWVYDSYTTGQKINNIWRRITTRLPKRLLYILCYFSIPYYYLKRIPFLGTFLQILLPSSNHRNWRWRVLDTFDWYSPKYQSKHRYPEVVEWFKETGLKDIEIREPPVSVKARKK